MTELLLHTALPEAEPTLDTNERKSFWNNAVVYQVYPWTFNEGERPEGPKGIGSLTGITEKLDYLKDDLEVNTIWISPYYKSPMVDGGYDIADYCDIHPDLGTMEDFEKMAAGLQEHGMKLMVDLVPNHTSDQHQWFQESRVSRDNDKSDWYIWRDPIIGENGEMLPPNNWGSVFSKLQLEARKNGELDVPDGDKTPYLSGWTWDEARGQYYFHSFAPEQPDLNWQNPAVQEAMRSVMRFWLDKGVDGFRVDAVNFIGKDPKFTDEEPNPDYVEGVWNNPYDQLKRENSSGFPETFHAGLRVMAGVLEEEKYRDRDTQIILEAYMPKEAVDEINDIVPGKMSAFNFAGMKLDWDGVARPRQIREYLENLPKGAIPNYVSGNHDKKRVASRIGERAARAAILVNLMLPGMTTIFQGEEGGFINADVPPDRQRDPLGGRDGARTPILWDDSLGHGFSKAPESALYLPFDPNQGPSIARQMEDPLSSFALYRELLRLKRTSPALREGDIKFLELEDDILGFTREHKDEELVVLANYSNRPRHIKLDESLSHAAFNLLVSSMTVRELSRRFTADGGATLAPREAIALKPIGR